MTRHYSSFVIRCWQRDQNISRITVEHIQSGETAQVESLAQLTAWIEQRWKEQPGSNPLEPGQAPPRER